MCVVCCCAGSHRLCGNIALFGFLPLDASAGLCFALVLALVQNFGMHWAAWCACWDYFCKDFLKAGFHLCSNKKVVGLVLNTSGFPLLTAPI